MSSSSSAILAAPAAAPSSDPYTPSSNIPEIIDARVEASKHMAIRHAAAVAAASIEKKLTTTLSTCETVHLTRDLTELQRCSLQSELGFLDALQRMTNEEMLETLFTLFDSDGSGSVDKNELARNLKKLDQRSFSESLDAAILSIHAFDCDGDGCMDLDEFADFIESLVNSLECALEDLAQFLTLRVAFCDSGSAVLDEAIVTLVQDSTASVLSVEDFDDAVVEVRMMLLFQMMAGSSELVTYESVAKALYRVTLKMDEIPRQALLLCFENEREQRTLDYSQFSSLLLNVSAAGKLNFHEVCNSITLSYCKNDVTWTDLSDLFVSDDTFLAIAADQEISENSGQRSGGNRHQNLDAVQQGKLNRLFDLWDMDHSGDLDFEEVVLGFRKFHEAKSLDQTLDQSFEFLNTFDKNNDGSLSRDEFAKLVLTFAERAHVSSHDLIDFMVVTSAFKDHSHIEQAYIKATRERSSDRYPYPKNLEESNSSRSLGGLWKNLRRGSSLTSSFKGNS